MKEKMTEREWKQLKRQIEKSAKKLKSSPYEAALHLIRLGLLYLWRFEAQVFSVENVDYVFDQFGKLADELKTKNVWNQKEIDIADEENKKLRRRIQELESQVESKE